MAKETPTVWLLAPAYAATQVEERALLKSEWAQQCAWWQQWLWWWFCWWNTSHIERLGTVRETFETSLVQELNRILAGDARCNLYRLGSDDLTEACTRLAPKSELYLFPTSVLPSKLEVEQLRTLTEHLSQHKHQHHFIERSSTQSEWFDVIATWIRVNLLQHDPSKKLQHIVLFVRRHLEHWRGFDARTDKKGFLISKELQQHFPTCSVHFLVNGPPALPVLDSLSDTHPILYGFVDDICGDQDTLNPILKRENLLQMTGIHDSRLLIRLLRKQIWNGTETAP